MSITMVDHRGFVAVLTYRRDDGSTWTSRLPVVAFEGRTPLVLGSTGLVEPDRRPHAGTPEDWWVEEIERTVIPAQPGWVVDVCDEYAGAYSTPVIAWVRERDTSDDEASSSVICVGRRERTTLMEFDLDHSDVQVRFVGESAVNQ